MDLEGGGKIPTYITLVRYTQQGAQNIKKSPGRLDAAKELFKTVGAQLKGYCLTLDQHDAVVIGEAPNEEIVAKLAFTIGAAGAIRTETLRAFTEDEFRELISALP
jgi:uncharacterized protein with GYD domain